MSEADAARFAYEQLPHGRHASLLRLCFCGTYEDQAQGQRELLGLVDRLVASLEPHGAVTVYGEGPDLAGCFLWVDNEFHPGTRFGSARLGVRARGEDGSLWTVARGPDDAEWRPSRVP